MAGLSTDAVVYTYKKLVVPVSMRSIYWKFFGFPASDNGEIITKVKIICILCKSQIAYNKNTSNLRMHLQNKHLEELMKVESEFGQSPVHKVKTPKKMKKTVAVRDAEDTGVDLLSTLERSVFEVEDSRSLFTTSKKPVQTQYGVPADDVRSTTEAIANFVIADLVPPDVVDGRGLQRLLVTLKSPCEIPSVMKLLEEIIPKLYRTAKDALHTELLNVTTDVGLTLEEWNHGSGLTYLSVSVYYQTDNHTLNYKLLTTIPVLSMYTSSTWEEILDAILTEWSIPLERVTACVYATAREELLTAAFNKGLVLIPALDFTIKECAAICFDNDDMRDILVKVRGIISFLNRNMHIWEATMYNDVPVSQMVSGIPMDSQQSWLTTLTMLEQLLMRQEVVDSLLKNDEDCAYKKSLVLGDDEWEAIQDVVSVLEPFKVSIMTLSEEKFPIISLLKPLLWQITQNRLLEKDGDSESLLNLKRALVEHLSLKYNDEQITPLLHSSTMLDPRFKLLPYCSDEEKESTTEAIKEAMRKIIEETCEENEPVAKKTRISGMELLLGNFTCKKIKQNPSESANAEYVQFEGDFSAPLDSCPILWWTKKRPVYSHLAVLADKYICIPACCSFPGKISPENFLNFIVKRSSFTSDLGLLDSVLFLHVNQGA